MSAGERLGIACPECGCALLEESEICDVCLADLGEGSPTFPSADPPPAAASSSLRFADVIAQLERLAVIAGEREDAAEAAIGASALLTRLRGQFLRDLGVEGSGGIRPDGSPAYP